MSNIEQRSVAIIGAGVSGLVSAVQMYKVGIRPTIFDKASDIGGMWNPDLKPCWNSMQTNISKFSTTLSDFPWPASASLFPSQREVYQHLSNYAQQSLAKDVFQLNTQVISVTYSEDPTSHWTVHYSATSKNILSTKFDFIIVASGFFGSSYMPDNIIGLPSFQGTLMHSSDYRSPEQVRNKRVIVAGASMSAAEIVADMATTAEHVTHIATHNFWAVPRFLPSTPNDPTSPFLPIDFVLFRRSTRTSDNETVLRTPELNKKYNEYYRSLTGGTQQSSYLIENADDRPPFLCISNMYAECNRTGKITLKQGRLTRIEEDGTLILNNGTTIKTTNDDILILCTGYRPCLDFFSKDILEQLSYTPDDLFCPLILHRNVFHPSLSNLAFVGMYRGAYWMIIELQARWIASIFSNRVPIPSVAEQEIGLDVERRVRAQEFRPQFPHGDYVGMINDFTREMIGLIPSTTMDIVVPAQYRPNEPDQFVLNEIDSICKAAKQGRFIAGVVICSLQESKWTFERRVKDRSTEDIIQGEAQFSLFEHKQQLLYIEQEKSNSSSLNVSEKVWPIARKYLYVYDENQDIINVYFVNNNDNSCGVCFHTIYFQPNKSSETSQLGRTAIGEHQNEQDHCTITYLFVFNGIYLIRFEITYTIKGPTKDYVSKTVFHREENK